MGKYSIIVRSGKRITSRRATLKAVGIATFGAIIAGLPITSEAKGGGKNVEQSIDLPPLLLESLLKTSLDSLLIKREIARLQQAGLVFDTSATTAKQTSAFGNFVGLQFESVNSPSPRYGASLFITTDIKSNKLASLQYVISWSLLHALEIQSMIFSAQDPLEIDLGGPDRSGSIVKRLFEPHLEQHWSFPRKEPIPPQPEELSSVGWPSELPNFPRWYFGGSAASSWSYFGTTPVYTMQATREIFSDQSRAPSINQLAYSDTLSPISTPSPLPTPASTQETQS